MGIKEELDKFYTKESIAKELIKNIEIDIYDCVIEPSAGNGSFSSQINHENLIALDLKPESNNIIQKDWFDYKIDPNYKNVLIIGNPPFGQRNNLSKSFIRHAISFENVFTIAFILPNVYNKHTNQKVFPSNWKLIKIIPIEKNGFILNGKEYHVPCSFYIWTKNYNGIDLRYDENKYKTNDFIFISPKEKENSDFFVMGASPKVIKDTTEVENTNRGYYIKSMIDLDLLKFRFKNINWSQHGNSSANGGVSWYSKTELIKVYEENKLI